MESEKNEQEVTPTGLQFNALNQAYEYFNKALFSGQLPGCILNFSRKKNTHGFMAPYRWKKLGEKDYNTHEISLTPYTLHREPKAYFSTLVHEQAHLWQFVFGKPSRSGYHNKEWAGKMKLLGLYPTDTGLLGGNETGQHMTHYIVEGGAYELAFEKMPQEFVLPFTSWEGLSEEPRRGNGIDGVDGIDRIDGGISPLGSLSVAKTKLKYSCPGCRVNVWGKPGLNLKCGDCDQEMPGE